MFGRATTIWSFPDVGSVLDSPVSSNAVVELPPKVALIDVAKIEFVAKYDIAKVLLSVERKYGIDMLVCTLRIERLVVSEEGRR